MTTQDPSVKLEAEPSITIDPTSKQVPPAAPSTPAKSEAPVDEKPSWLDARLERERKSLLKDLGFDSLEDGKKAADEAKAAREAKKTDAEKRIELAKNLEDTQKEAARQADAIKAFASLEMAKLTAEQQAAVKNIAGEDLTLQLKTIASLAPTWNSAASAKIEAAKPADTAPKPNAPRDVSSAAPAPVDHKAVYESLKESNPILAARYAAANNIFS